MLKNLKYVLLGFLVSICLAFSILRETKNNDITLGAYYFDGWTGAYPNHITKKLVDSFSLREPKWGWLTSSQQIVNEQIDEASNAGLSFFSFCWYMNSSKKPSEEPLNNALKYFRNSPNKNKLKYCIMVANHQGYEIDKNDWNLVSKEWLELFSDKSYLKVNEKPLLIFFSINSLITKFGSTENVKSALDSLRYAAVNSGLRGISFAVCINPSKTNIQKAESCGFDILTGYNYHSAGFRGNKMKIPIDSLIFAERKVWDSFNSLSKLNYIPVSTLNWDPRPWANTYNNYAKEPYYVGFSPESVFRSVKNCVSWIKENTRNATKEKIAILYAWNENGEGAWLTPGKNGFNPSKRLKKALSTSIK
ncbi:glycoside hydrolase family 99-like domain-containing protein [Arcicella rosea]|uniref:Glycosyltransferase WbsX n=1 Tax=Arcicella rosea TaxID=502909 RepID=A0A841EGE1_9BACT|nr:glycoside hydrolase family 99-like domain-containing protein [Arcicella rosea]MBB6002422.1 hypothetical protein [Arcicella rosea]